MKTQNKMKFFFHNKKPKDECAVFGIYNHKDAASLTVLGLHALQHRGQDSTGIVTSDIKTFLLIEEWVRFQKFSLNRM